MRESCRYSLILAVYSASTRCPWAIAGATDAASMASVSNALDSGILPPWDLFRGDAGKPAVLQLYEYANTPNYVSIRMIPPVPRPDAPIPSPNPAGRFHPPRRGHGLLQKGGHRHAAHDRNHDL